MCCALGAAAVTTPPSRGASIILTLVVNLTRPRLRANHGVLLSCRQLIPRATSKMEPDETGTTPLMGVEPQKRSRAYAVLAWFLVVACAATTITLALVFPVRKHKFQRFHCLSRNELTNLATQTVKELVPAVAGAVCGAEKKECDAYRQEFVDVDLETFCANRTLDICENRTSISAACVATSVCQAAEDYYRSPEGYCVNATRRHESTCAELTDLVASIETQVQDYCAAQGGTTQLACNILKQSLEDRGHWVKYCKGFGHRIECQLIQTTVNNMIQQKVCSKSAAAQKLCDVGYAIAKRWQDKNQPVPILDALTAAKRIYCTEGCKSFLHDEVHLLTSSLPSICGAWPPIESICRNVTLSVAAFCAASPLACEWLVELPHLNASTAEQLFLQTWQQADALCASSAAADQDQDLLRSHLNDENLHENHRLLLGASNIRNAACDAVGAIDNVAVECPDMLPLIDAAVAS